MTVEKSAQVAQAPDVQLPPATAPVTPTPVTAVAVEALSQPTPTPTISLVANPNPPPITIAPIVEATPPADLSTDNIPNIPPASTATAPVNPTQAPTAPPTIAPIIPDPASTTAPVPAASPAPTIPPVSATAPVARVTPVIDLKQYDHEEILKFLRGELANIRGITLTEMQDFPFGKKEKQHDYIQWMFPTKDISEQQEGAGGPAINDDFIAKLNKDVVAIENAKKSFSRMLYFYGLQYDGTTISKSNTFEDRASKWCPGNYNHNHSRITRILESLKHFGLKKESAAFFDCLKKLWLEKPERFTNETMEKHWCKEAGYSWKDLQEECAEVREENYIEGILDGLIKAKNNTHWIQSDLTVDESSGFGRVLWAIIKYIKCLRSFFYGVDLQASKARWEHLTVRVMGTENPRLERLREKWAEAACNFNKIVSLKNHISISRKFNHIEFVVKPGDVTKEPTDVIVNAANEALLGGGGVDGNIHKAGGGKILEECKTIRAQREKEGRSQDSEPGEAVTTSAGKLPATFVVHTVGPRWQGGTKQEEEILYKAYANSLDQVAQKGKASVNFPSISTGIFGFPLHKAVPKMIEAVQDHSTKASSVRTVRLLAFDENTYLAFATVLLRN